MMSAPDLTTPWSRAVYARALFAVDPSRFGAVLRSGAGPARDAWLKHLSEDLAPATPMRRAPAHITDDRLLGGLDLAATLRSGRPVAEPGLLAQIDGGVLVLAMAERIAANAAARIVRAFDRGEVSAEREGFSSLAPSRFGIVALDEGDGEDERPPPALMERLAFWIDLTEVSAREVDERPVSPEEIAEARARLGAIETSEAAISTLVAVAAQLGVASLRAPLHALAAARAAAALRGGARVEEPDIAVAAALTLAPRATRMPAPPSQSEPDEAPQDEAPQDKPPQDTPPEGTPPEDRDPDDAAQETPPEISADELEDIILAAARAAIPSDLMRRIEMGLARRSSQSQAGKAGANMASKLRGRPIGARAGALREGRLGLVETLRAAAPWQRLRRGPNDDPRRVRVRVEDFRIRRFRQKRGTTAIFVVDASGSSAMQRLAEVKGAIELLLVDCYVRRDSVALVAFRGKGAEIVLPPTRSLARAKRTLAGLPGGGGTPIASGIDTALALADRIKRQGQSPLMVLMTDGRANVARDGAPGRAHALEDALRAARQARAAGLAALAIDTSAANARRRRRRPRPGIAEAMSARYLKLPQADAARGQRGRAQGGRDMNARARTTRADDDHRLRLDRDGKDWPLRDTSRFVEAGGLRWHVQMLGRGPVLLLVHGAAAATHSWRDLAPMLARHFASSCPICRATASPIRCAGAISRFRAWRARSPRLLRALDAGAGNRRRPFRRRRARRQALHRRRHCAEIVGQPQRRLAAVRGSRRPSVSRDGEDAVPQSARAAPVRLVGRPARDLAPAARHGIDDRGARNRSLCAPVRRFRPCRGRARHDGQLGS